MSNKNLKRGKEKNRTEWNLSLLYKSPDDPQIEMDISLVEKAYATFAKKYKNSKEYLKSDTALAKALSDYEKIMDLPASKTYFYLHLAQDKDSRDQKIRAKMNLLTQRLQKLSNIIIFFEINISKIPESVQSKLIKSEKLSRYRYLLKKMFENGKYVLTEPEEKILTLKSLPSHILWTKAVEKIRSKQTVDYKGKQIPLSEAEPIIRKLQKQNERLELYNKIIDKYYSLSDVAESELNAIVTNKKINDELRGYKEPYDETILGYENNRKSVLNLVNVVTENFHVSQRFYAIKTKMLKLKKLYYADRAVPVGKTKTKVTFDKSCKILTNLFTGIDPKFGEILKRYIKNGQIDAFPKIGKKNGAYCSSIHDAPVFVLLNHADTFDSLMTFGHEMGHAIHSEFSKSQPVLYEDHSTATAEVASTLFECFVFYNQFEKLTEKEKIVALHDKIQDDIQTIFRQIACFNFELEMHKTIRQKGNMPKEELALCMNRHMKSYIGKIELTEKDGYFFVGWPHIRNFFYVYSYAFGQLASKAIYEKYKEDKSYIKEIKKFLSLGGSMSPEDIFKSIGVDVTKPDFFKNGIKSIEKDIILLESLVKKNGKK
ncbi:MAG: M3 family metallopeptidase [Minisyncoccia bacterium]